jgi:hypothetical protein
MGCKTTFSSCCFLSFIYSRGARYPPTLPQGVPLNPPMVGAPATGRTYSVVFLEIWGVISRKISIRRY